MPLNATDDAFAVRLLDFFGSHPAWQRGLWSSGLVLTLREILEASEACREGVISEASLESLGKSVVRIAGRDGGIRPEQRNVLIKALQGNMAPHGAAFSTVKALVADLDQDYLKNWRICDRSRISGERVARAIASHLLDQGFSSTQLHHWCTYQRNHAKDFGDLVEHASNMAVQGPQTFRAYVGFESIPFDHDGPRENFITAQEFTNWLAGTHCDTRGLRLSGALLFTIDAHDRWAAAARAVETVHLLESRVALGTPKRLVPAKWLWIEKDASVWQLPFQSEQRSVEIHALHRENKLYFTETSRVDGALDLLGMLRSGPAGPALGAAWAAIESTMSGPGDRDMIAAERLAAVVACSYPRAELTALSYRCGQAGPLAAALAACTTNRDRAATLEAAIRDGSVPPQLNASDIAALLRIQRLLNDPRKCLRKIREQVAEAFRRLYRHRNLVLHGGKTDSVGLRPALRSAAPLIGAGFDRIAHAWFVEGLNAMEIFARAEIRLNSVGESASGGVTDLLD